MTRSAMKPLRIFKFLMLAISVLLAIKIAFRGANSHITPPLTVPHPAKDSFIEGAKARQKLEESVDQMNNSGSAKVPPVLKETGESTAPHAATIPDGADVKLKKSEPELPKLDKN